MCSGKKKAVGAVMVAGTLPLVASRPCRAKILMAAWLARVCGKALHRLLVERESEAHRRRAPGGGGECFPGLQPSVRVPRIVTVAGMSVVSAALGPQVLT